jgi:methionyl-tRNA synthetase
LRALLSMNKVLVCVAWPYANGPIHVGHVAGSLLPADIFARFNRMVGNDVVMVSGSDMHGAPITVSADREKVSPETVANRYHEINSKAIAGLGICFDLFTSTHTKNHEAVAQDLFSKLMGKGHLDRRSTMQFYCISCSRFLPDRYVEGRCPHCSYDRARGDQCDSCGMDLNAEQLVEAKCQLCGSSPELRETEHFFLKLSDFNEDLIGYVEGNKHWRPHVRSFTLNVLKEGLIDRPITRDISWGVPVPYPGFETKRVYVWFEAVAGYLSATKEWALIEDRPDAWKSYWTGGDCRSYYFLGKDNIIFHTIIWPAMLMGVGGLNLPYDVVANQFMNLGGQKFSKSMGVSIDIPDLLTRFEPDVLRYYLAANMPEMKDSEFSWDDFGQRVNSELVATYGNFVHRALSFTFKNYGEMPGLGELDDRDRAALDRIAEAGREVRGSLESCEFRAALKAIMDLAQYGNQYFDAVAPWSLVRSDRDRCGTVLHISLSIAKALAVMTSPFMPFSSERIWRQLGFDEGLEEVGWQGIEKPLKEGARIEKPVPQFAKVEAHSSGEGFEPVSSLDLRVGKVLEVRSHPNADKLYVITVDIGHHITIVSGLKEFYTADELTGKTIIVLSNLEPAKLRGVKSEGMLLAAEDDNKLALLTPERDLPPGTQIASGRSVGSKRISFKAFQGMEIMVGVPVSGEGQLLDLGSRKVSYSGGRAEADKRYAAFVEDDNALVMSGPDEVLIVFDRDIPVGAKIR